jgi:hypothetical protein
VRLALNIALFQAAWFACVLGAARGWPWAGPIAATAAVGWQAASAARPAAELGLVAAAVIAGALFDSALAALGWIVYAPAAAAPFVAPWWILAMWAAFATTLNVSLDWLKPRLRLAAALGAVAGPCAYWAGARLGAIELREPLGAMTLLGAGWAVTLPALLVLARRLEARPT